MNETVLSVRMDADVKTGFDEACAMIGMSAVDAVNLFALAVMKEGRMPFDASIFDKAKTEDSKGRENGIWPASATGAGALPQTDRGKSVRGLAADCPAIDCLEYAEIVESLSGCIPPIPDDADHKELLAQWRREDYENLD